MKGFIEITLIKKERKAYINVRNIESISVVDGEMRVNTVADLFAVKETYAELKALIEAATDKTNSCGDCDCPYNPNNTIEPALDEPPELSGFKGTRDALNNLGVERKDDDFEESCEFCNEGALIVDKDCDYGIEIEDENLRVIEIKSDKYVLTRSINFCPMCGRNLKGE